MAHGGYKHLVKTSLMCCNVVLKGTGMDEAVLAPCAKVLMTLYLATLW